MLRPIIKPVKQSGKRKKHDPELQPTLLTAAEAKTRANLSPKARAYLVVLGVREVDTQPVQAALIWQHALAIAYAPAYRRENADGLSDNYPRIPLPATRDLLEASAALGRRVAAVLDTTAAEPADESLYGVAVWHKDGAGAMPRWGTQTKKGVQPGKGRVEAVGDAIRVYASAHTYWNNVPTSVWKYTIGGYQVLKKWLSYRDETLLGRPLSGDEIDHFTHTARRLTALIALEAALDANYTAIINETLAW